MGRMLTWKTEKGIYQIAWLYTTICGISLKILAITQPFRLTVEINYSKNS